jgi:hypothetical protein
MSIWGMGMDNPVKYYLYVVVIAVSFGLTKELQQRLMGDSVNFKANIIFLLTGTLILTGLTIALFSQYELSIFKHYIRYELKQNPGLDIKLTFQHCLLKYSLFLNPYN